MANKQRFFSGLLSCGLVILLCIRSLLTGLYAVLCDLLMPTEWLTVVAAVDTLAHV